MKKLLLLFIPLIFFFGCEEEETNQNMQTLNEVGYFHTDGDFYKTTDSGASWSLQGSSGLSDVKGISFVSESIGYCQNEGDFYKTTDSGVNWSLASNGGVGDDVHDISFVKLL